MYIRHSNILLIDDDSLFRRQLLAWLELWGAQVQETDSADEALLLAAKKPPDLVLGNLMMQTARSVAVLSVFRQQFPALPFVVTSSASNMAEVAAALRAGAVDYLIKPVTDWSGLKHRLAVSLLPSGYRTQQELAEFHSHLAFYRRQDMAASRLLRDLVTSGDRQLGSWRLSLKHSTPWVLTQSVRLEQDLLLMVAEFDPLHPDTPMLMVLVAFLLNEPLRRFRQGQDSLLNHPARTLEYINQQLYEAGLNARVSLMLLRLNADNNTVEVANGGMTGCDWLCSCNAGPLGQALFRASPRRQSCRFPLQLQLCGSHGGRIELTASREA
ncbi:response regulator [Oceanimonas sp. AH20CE76]|uniref:response regulator n=1 Tax=Oceanimonas TaxID=129577 RepID=UPI0031FEA7B4